MLANHYERDLFFEMDDLPERARVYLFGAGAYGRNLLGELRACRPDIRVQGIIDSVRRGSVDGVSIVSPAEIGEYDTIILATPCWHGMGAALLDRSIDRFSLVRAESAMVHSVIRSRDGKVMYTVCSRTGSSSVITALGEGSSELEVISQRDPDDMAFAFTFVRNPFNRVVSCYHGHLGDNLSPFGRNLLRLTGRESMSFPDFVRWLQTEPTWAMDNHLRPYAMLVPSWIDYVGHLEDTQEAIDHIFDQTGYILKLLRCFPSKRKSPDYRSYYTPELKDIVEEVYAEDLDRFNYIF